MTRRLVIVRHGNTFEPGEAPRRIGARTDLRLTAGGRDQAAHLAGWFAAHGYHFDRALCAPLRRTRDTAETILSAQPLSPEIEASEILVEIDHGPDENQTEAAVVERIGAAALLDWDERGIAPDGWTVEYEARLAGWRALLADETASTTLLVTSNGAARFALFASAPLLSRARQLPSLKLRTAAFGIIEIDGAGPRLVSWDQRP